MNLTGLDGIIFDFDGVLVESISVKTQAFGALYEHYGKEIVAQVENYHLSHGGMSRFHKFRYFQTEILKLPPLSEREVEQLATAFSKRVIDQVVAAPMVLGARAFLDSAGSHLPLFIVSGTPTGELDEILTRRELRQDFSAIWGSPGSKADHIADLLRKHELAAERCVMIGDAMADYEGAMSNNVPFLGRVARNTQNLFPGEVKTFVDFSTLPESWC